jgi:hypothetical protein
MQEKAKLWSGEEAPSGTVEVTDIQAAADAGLLDVQAVNQLVAEAGQETTEGGQ